MLTQEQVQALELEYNLARNALANAQAGRRTGEERRFGLAYQALVRAGLRQQIRKKYRG